MIVGLTGGIGSGKTTVAKMFEELGVPVFYADTEAKRILNTYKRVQKKMTRIFGVNAYVNGALNSKYIASIVFKDTTLLQQLNSLVHPIVRKNFLRWVKKQQAPYTMQEAAILFENGAYKNFDALVLVTAPENDRLKRVQKRDNVPVDHIKDRMNQQWEDPKKIPLATFVISNTNLNQTKEQVLDIHKKLVKESTKTC